MKRTVIIVMAALLIVLSATGCGDKNKTNDNDLTGQTQVSAGNVKIGLGVEVEGKGSSAEADASGKGSSETYIAAVAFDGDGKTTDVKLDCVESEHAFDAAGSYLTDNSHSFSKKERGNDYGMRAASSIGKEWFEQVEALETWMKGKTAKEIADMKLSDGKADDPEIKSSCTISVDGFLKAVNKAADKAK